MVRIALIAALVTSLVVVAVAQQGGEAVFDILRGPRSQGIVMVWTTSKGSFVTRCA